MNSANYQIFGAPVSTTTYNGFFNFTLPPSSTGFYRAVRDTGSCMALSRLRVYRNNYKYREVGLVIYPDTPAPVSGSVTIDISCVENAVVSGSARVTCRSDGTWGPENHVCQCRLGYEERETECVGKYPVECCVRELTFFLQHAQLVSMAPVGTQVARGVLITQA